MTTKSKKTLRNRRKYIKNKDKPEKNRKKPTSETDRKRLQEVKQRVQRKRISHKNAIMVPMKPREKEVEAVYFNWSQEMQDSELKQHSSNLHKTGTRNDTNHAVENGETTHFSTLKIPQKTTHATCSGVRGVRRLAKLPSDLVSLECASCIDLEELPQELPESLRILDCRNCPKLRELPTKLPKGLEKLLCSGCHFLSMPELPESLVELDCDSRELQSLVTRRKQLRELLQGVDNEIVQHIQTLQHQSQHQSK